MEKIFTPKLYLPLLYILIGLIIYLIIKSIIARIFVKAKTKNDKSNRRKETLCILIQNIAKYSIIIFTILAILTVYGINVQAILAGLGIVGVVFGLAFQDTLKDFLAGIFIILEDHFSVGDTIEINGFKGEVIFIGLKTTKLQEFSGAVKMISNRNISEVINYTMEKSLASVDIAISYEEDNDKVEKVLNTLAKKLTKKLPNLKGEVKSIGIISLDNSAVIYRLTVETEPMQQYGIEREIRKEVKKTLDKEQIKIPYPQIEVHNARKRI